MQVVSLTTSYQLFLEFLLLLTQFTDANIGLQCRN